MSSRDSLCEVCNDVKRSVRAKAASLFTGSPFHCLALCFSQDTHVASSYVTHGEDGEGLYSVVTGSLDSSHVATVSY